MNFFYKILRVTYLLFLFNDFCLTRNVSSQNIQYIFPVPNSEFVSQKTTIIIRSQSAIDNSSLDHKNLLTVSGSSSGAHIGKFSVSDDDRTLLFKPTVEFSLGEIVTVNLNDGLILRTGICVHPFSFSFKITSTSQVDRKKMVSSYLASQSHNISSAKSDNQAGKQSSLKKTNDEFPPDFPQFEILVNDHPAPGAFFFSTNMLPIAGVSSYLSIIDNSGKPIFLQQTSTDCHDFKLQSNGLLTYGMFSQPNAWLVLDSTYSAIDTIRAENGYINDFHELHLLPNGHALFLCIDMELVDMSKIVAFGLPQAAVFGLIIQELDRQKNVVFEWSSWDNYKITDAIGIDFTQPNIDYVHGNSIEVDHDGNLLFSSRNLNEITKINHQTGEIIWRLGGKNNQFTFINDTLGFSYQHDVRRLANGNITLYDNGVFHSPQFSRALEYTLNEDLKTATLVWQYRNSPDIFGEVSGNVQRLSNGNTLIGWGHSNLTLTEVRPDGTKTYELNFINPFITLYRVYKFPWKSSATSVMELPSQFSLGQNYPNPLSLQYAITTIQYSLSKREHVQLKLYDIFGQEVKSLVDDVQNAGQHFITFNINHLSGGVYFYHIITPTETQTKSMIISK